MVTRGEHMPASLWPTPSSSSPPASSSSLHASSGAQLSEASTSDGGNGGNGRGSSHRNRHCLRLYPEVRPRETSEKLEELCAQEDACFDADFLGSASDGDEYPDAWICPFLPSPAARILRLAALLPLGAGDHLLDLGCGDGRVLVGAAAAVPGLVATGVEIDAGLVEKAKAAAAAARAGVGGRCRFRCADALQKEDRQASASSSAADSWTVLCDERVPWPVVEATSSGAVDGGWWRAVMRECVET